MIRSFRDQETAWLFTGRPSPRVPPDIVRRAMAKLLQINAAASLADLKVPPGNRLERLSGDRQGQYSIRVNDQWRICFQWKDGHAHDVEMVDYHR